ncbi:Holliday junction resolvase RuvX [Candidatus Bipolaricaulota bacterium]|nr:Holliday junction resolvase RuvX [Candidatus Bipolaricaulota bacterium]
MGAIALDLGEKRVGIARTDETGILAVPHGVYQRRSLHEDLDFLANLARELQAEVIVVGLPLNMDGTEGSQAQKVREFSRALAEKSGLPVVFVDERWTTAEVERAMREAGERPSRRKEKVDALSAVLILQTWLETQRKGGDEGCRSSRSI